MLNTEQAFQVSQACAASVGVFVRDDQDSYFVFGSLAYHIAAMANEGKGEEAVYLRERIGQTWNYSHENFSDTSAVACVKLYGKTTARMALFMLASGSFSVTVMNGEPKN